MGVIRVPVSVRALEETGESYTAEFLVDTGSTDTLVPADVLQRLGMTQTPKRLPVLPLKLLAA
jgi:predicted aspartyl protease